MFLAGPQEPGPVQPMRCPTLCSLVLLVFAPSLAAQQFVAELDAAIDAAVDNDYLTSALRTIRTHLVRVRRLASDHPDRLTASVTEHVTIALAIADGNADLAAHATHVHLHNALTSILTYLPENE